MGVREKLKELTCKEVVRMIIDNRYLSLVFGMFLMLAAGTEYMFSTYSTDLKHLLDYNQTQINFLGTCGNLGIYLGIYMGLLYDLAGVRITIVVGGIFLFVGWFGVYLGSISVIPTNYIFMGFFMFIQGNGSNAIYTSALAGNVKKFSAKARGTIVGILVSMFGLSSAIFSPIYVHVFDSNVQDFLLFFSICLPLIAFSGILFISPASIASYAPLPPIDPLSGEEKKKPEAQKKEDDWQGVPIKEEINSLTVLRRLDFWLLFTIFMLGAGIGLTFINNLGSIVETMGGESASTFVTILSVFNCGGRLLFGFSSDVIVKFKIIPRAGCLAIAVLLIGLAQVYMLFAVTFDSIYYLLPAIITIGLAYGGIMTVSPALTNELFGQKYFGGNWSLVRVSPAISSFFLSTLLTGKIYDHFASDNGATCHKWACFGWSFFSCCFIALFALILCIILTIRWKIFEKKLNSGLISNKTPLV